MKPMLIVGILLLLLGGGLMVAGHITVKDTDPVVDLGKVEITKTKTEHKPIPIVVSGGLMVAGLVLTIAGAMKKGD